MPLFPTYRSYISYNEKQVTTSFFKQENTIDKIEQVAIMNVKRNRQTTKKCV